MTDLLLVVTATETKDDALTLAKHLCGQHLAGTAQITEATTVYWHAGNMGTGTEWRIELATTSVRLADLERELIEQHPWSNPQFVVTEIVHTTEAYRDWAIRSTRSVADPV